MNQKPTYEELSRQIKLLQEKVLKRSQPEETIDEGEEKYKLLINNLPCVVYKGFKDYSIEFFDNKIKSFSGYDADEFNSKKMKWVDIIVEEDIKAAERVFRRALKTNKSYVREYRIRTKFDDMHWIQERGQIIRDIHGKLEYVSGVFFDITQQKQAEEALMITQFAVDCARDSIYWVAPDAGFTYANDAACRALGYSRQELLAMTMHDIDPGFSKKVWPAHWADLKRRGSFSIETSHRRKDGTTFPVEIAVNHVKIGNNEFNCAFARDMTQHKKMQGQLVQAQKFKAIGTLAQGVAHDFNNLLSIIMGYISLAEEDLNPQSGVLELLKEAEKASLRAKDLTKQLISSSKGAAPVKKIIAIGDLIKKIADTFLPEPDLAFEFSILPDLWPVEFDEAHMKYALKNMMVNAVESMPAGGTIAVGTENLNVRSTIKEPNVPLADGKYIKISIRDQGIGISKEHLSRIFDPYFSTKEIGNQKGMGMGLTATYSIINKHNGHIAVESEPGTGTTFTIYLPAFEIIGADLVPANITHQKEPAALTGKILLMDDEKMIRDVAQTILHRLGYKPELAQDGAQAVEMYRQAMNSGQPFDAVILDLNVTNGMGGKEAVKKLREINPQIKAVVSSGSPNEPEITDYKTYGFTEVLIKPYKMKDLGEVLTRVITANQSVS